MRAASCGLMLQQLGGLSGRSADELDLPRAGKLEQCRKQIAAGTLPDVVRHEPIRKPHTVGRNEPCPCGSGKKLKRCHGSADRLH
jgi:hypothetical protein